MTSSVPRRIDAVAEISRIPTEAGFRLHLGAWPLEISDVPAGVGAYVVRLRDSWGEVRWEPGDGEEFSGAGRVFAAVVQCLYDGRKQQACIRPAISASMQSQDLTFSGTEEEKSEHLWDGNYILDSKASDRG